uniref:NADH-ubiquinone oxidoreductase chain 2 n=1 Tax=Porichthys myriaster TaxID=262771 RepID=Q5GM83_9TELE|nr:NADH dehydrogenase subunit 2 [Porichthys myriaster]
MSPFVLFLFLFNLGLGTTITFASSHWLLAWMGLELNTLAIIPLMIQHHHPRATEASAKYFMVQATATAILLFSTTSSALMLGQWNIYELDQPLFNALFMLALSLKLGLAPLHAWLPEVLQGLDLMTGLILSTWQKLAPLILLLQIPPTNINILLLLGLTSMLVGGWGGLNQTQLRKILAYSSIAHLGWMVVVMKIAPSISLLALLAYILMTFSLFSMFLLNKTLNINSLSLSWTKSPFMMVSVPALLLTLAGLPPLTGFMPKWLILQELANQNLVLLAVLATMSSLLSLFFYLRLSYSIMLISSPNNTTHTAAWRQNHKTLYFPLSITTILSTLSLPLTPLLLAVMM